MKWSSLAYQSPGLSSPARTSAALHGGPNRTDWEGKDECKFNNNIKYQSKVWRHSREWEAVFKLSTAYVSFVHVDSVPEA